MSSAHTCKRPCHYCEGRGGWTDYGRGWPAPEPDEWVMCEDCGGTGEIVEECDELPSPPAPARPAAPTRCQRPVVDDLDLEVDYDDCDPFAD